MVMVQARRNDFGGGAAMEGGSGKKFQKLKPIASRFPGIWCHFSVR